ncbi:MAG: HAD family hydrolase [Pararhizobium sp.]
MTRPEDAGEALVIFDLDGTLIDTAVDLVESLNHAIGTIGLKPFGAAEVGHLVGQGARVMIDRALVFHGHPGGVETIDRLLPIFLEHYAASIPGMSKPYPELVEALDGLASAGMRLAVCTNKQEAFARTLIDRLSLSDRFVAITGGDTFPVRKPDAGHILGTLTAAGGDLANAVMVGDSINDIAAARNAGIPSVAVSFGYSDAPVDTLGATVVIDRYADLTPALIRSLVDEAAHAAKVATR